MISNDIDPEPHPYLEGLVGQLTGRRFVVDSSRVLIGRDASQCQIVLGQSVISKVQAALEVDELRRVTLVDLSGKGTTFVNGQPVTRKQLKDGDCIGLGLGGVVSFNYHSALPGVEYRDVRSATGERAVSRMIISTAQAGLRRSSSPRCPLLPGLNPHRLWSSRQPRSPPQER